jgi:energy-coupling factor transporter transmembrane protein EcfT
MAGIGIVGAVLAFAAFGRKAFGTGTFETIMIVLGMVTLGFGIAALIVETSWALLVPMVVGIVIMWALALMHDAGYVAADHVAGHA